MTEEGKDDILLKASAISKFILNNLVPPSMVDNLKGKDDIEKAYNFVKDVKPC